MPTANARTPIKRLEFILIGGYAFLSSLDSVFVVAWNFATKRVHRRFGMGMCMAVLTGVAQLAIAFPQSLDSAPLHAAGNHMWSFDQGPPRDYLEP
jgi:hypothetical protein